MAGYVLNDNGEGPWGGGGGSGDGGDGDGGLGPRNPWSQPPRRRSGRRSSINPSAIEQLVNRGRERFGGRLPNGFENRSMWGWALLAFACLWIVLTSMHRVEPQQRGIVTRFGRYVATLGPGVGLTFPAPIDTVTKLNVDEIRQIDIGAGASDTSYLVLTGDENIIDLAYSVRWSIRDPELYMFALADPEDTIREVAESAMRAEIARVTLQDAIGPGRGAIEDRVQARMQQILDGYRAGIEVEGVAINQADPPSAVNDAFKAVSAAQQQAQSDINNANAYAQQMIAKAQGDAAAFDKVFAQYRLAPEVTRRRMYYETMEEVLSRVDKTVVETPGVMPYLPLPQAKPKPQAEGNASAGEGQ
ncbi:MAG: protease modulator HflK [Sphingomonadaceae bacterium]|nr:protease modulator HflK [Sphingomonadaceae bacterium]